MHNDLYFRGFNTEIAMKKAMENVEKHYAVVGILEELNKTLTVLEHYVPRFFKGALNTYWSKSLTNVTRSILIQWVRQYWVFISCFEIHKVLSPKVCFLKAFREFCHSMSFSMKQNLFKHFHDFKKNHRKFVLILQYMKWFCYIEKIIEWQNSQKAYKNKL